MNKFYLIRHGNRPHSPQDLPLSQLGVQQARITAINFKDKDITQIYCSPPKRAYETAQIIAEELGVENIKVDERLKERFNWGDGSFQIFDKFIEGWKKTTNERNYTPIGGDSSQNAGKRLKKFVDELSVNNKDKSIILVTHGGVIVDLLRNLFDDDYLKTFSPNFLNSGIGECSITQLTVHNGRYNLKDFDFVSHLPEPLRLRSLPW